MKGKNMMKMSTKLIVTGAASVLGVALAAGGAYAATGSMTTADVPGRVLQVSGVGPASAHAGATAMAHASPNAKGLRGATAAHPHATTKMNATAMAHASPNVKGPSGATTMPMAKHGSVGQVAPPAAQPLPAYHAVTPSPMASMQPAVPQPASTTSGMSMSAQPMR
jgi:hypothetical protein